MSSLRRLFDLKKWNAPACRIIKEKIINKKVIDLKSSFKDLNLESINLYNKLVPLPKNIITIKNKSGIKIKFSEIYF